MDHLVLSEFESLPLHKIVYIKLRESILSGALKPGEKLIENDLSKQLKISKTPIREAIRVLSQEGLIVHNTRRGITVIDFTAKDVWEIITLRTEIEAMGIRLTIDNIDKNDYKILDKIINQLVASAKQKKFTAMAKADMKFHHFLMEKSGNSRLVTAWNTIASQMQVLLQMIDFYSFTPNYSEQNHRKLIQAIQSGDQERTAALIKEHVATSMDLILKQFHNVKNGNQK
ncbi:MAG: GntR family transcriptional regulator [Bacteroidetes bacterium]|nr:GntR family transcriptional regulator [Bacteroidota bacterium]